jgi:hypothetical protein
VDEHAEVAHAPPPGMGEKHKEEPKESHAAPAPAPHVDSFDENDVVIPTIPPVEPRRLVPMKSNIGRAAETSQTTNKRKTHFYSKEEIMALKPSEGNYQKLSLMGTIQVVGEGGAGGAGGYNAKSPAPYGSGKHAGRGSGGAGGGRGGGGDYNRGGDQSPVNAGGEGGFGWQREALPVKKNKAATPVVPPKKKELDPIEKFATDATYVLNRMTAVTFEKFSTQILNFPLNNTMMLDKLVELIFEKAIYDPPSFTPMYADLCLLLKEKSNWIFFTVARMHDTNDYFWIRDFQFPEEAAGPYFSQAEAIGAFNTDEELPTMKPLTSPITTSKPAEIILLKNNLIKLMLNMSDQYFVTWVPMDSIPDDQKSQSVFSSDKEAQKDAGTELSFRGRLAHSCELEFQKSVADDTVFGQLNADFEVLKTKRSQMSPEEFEMQESEIMEKRGKIKRRMIGNIRFVGELYKKKLLNTETMHDCIGELLGHPPEWKNEYDEQELELLCDLLETIGEALESKTKKLKTGKGDYQRRFDSYFDRMQTLSQDKKIISRIRFKLETVIGLRNNGWVKRKPQDAPPTKPQEQDNRQSLPRGGAPTQPRILPRGGPQDARSQTTAGSRDSYDARSRDTRDNERDSGASGKYGSKKFDNEDTRGKGGYDDKRSSYRKEEPVQKQTQPAATASAPKTNQIPSSSSAASSAAASTTSVPTKETVASEDFKDAHVRRAVGISIDEVMSGVELNELKTMLKESSYQHTGYFIQVLMEKFANTSNSSQKEKFLSMLDDSELINWLTQYHFVVERAVEVFEPLRGLVDTLMDIVQVRLFCFVC